jgi:hypothetical protein
MKVRFHRWLLGLILLLLMPGTLLASLLFIGLIYSSYHDGFLTSYFVSVPILLIPPALIWWGFRLLPGLRQGFHHKLRRHLLAYYLVVSVYCAFWLFSTASRAGNKSQIFPFEIQIAGSVILILPVLITLFTSPEAKRIWNPNSGGNLHLHGRTDRFVAWLASRFR